MCGSDYDEVTEYQLLVCCLSEQTVVEESVRRLRTKEDGGLYSGMPQNPSDPDAAFRTKAGKEYQRYAANREETVGNGGAVATDYQYEQNSQFLKDSLERTPLREEMVTLVAEGAYSGKENCDLAVAKKMRLVNTDLAGQNRKPVDIREENPGSAMYPSAGSSVRDALTKNAAGRSSTNASVQ